MDLLVLSWMFAQFSPETWRKKWYLQAAVINVLSYGSGFTRLQLDFKFECIIQIGRTPFKFHDVCTYNIVTSDGTGMYGLV